MLNYLKFFEILISLQSLIFSTMIPVFISLPFSSKFEYSLEIPITWQIPTIILISLIFKKKVVFIAFSIYLFLGLFVVPVFHQGGSLGYLLTPNFGYLIGMFALIITIDKLNKKDKIYIFDFLKFGIMGIFFMHIIGIFYTFIQLLTYKQTNVFLYNIGFYSFGKIGYHFLMLIPLSLLIRPLNRLKY